MTAIARNNGGQSKRDVPTRPDNCLAVNKSDTDVWQQPVHLYVLDAGDVNVVDAAGNPAQVWTVTAGMLTAGPWLVPHRCTQLKATGTTATSVRAVF